MKIQNDKMGMPPQTGRTQTEDAEARYRSLLNEQRQDPSLRHDSAFQTLLQNARQSALTAAENQRQASTANTAGTGRGADNPQYAQNRAYGNARGERLKQVEQESGKSAEKAAAQLRILDSARRSDPALEKDAGYQAQLIFLKRASEEAERKREKAKNAYSQWENGRWNTRMSGRYGALRQQADYREKAQANPSYAKGRDFHASAQEYAYINDIDGYRSTFKARAVINGTGAYMAKYDYITPEEIADYNYLFAIAGPNAAKAYLRDYLNPGLNEQSAENAASHTKELAKKHPALASAASVPLNLMSGAGVVDLTVQKLDRAITGSQRPIEWNTPTQTFSAAAPIIRETVSERIERPIGKFLYNTGMGIADSAAVYILSAMGIPGGALLLGGGAERANGETARRERRAGAAIRFGGGYGGGDI